MKNERVEIVKSLLSHGVDERIGYFVSACAVSIYAHIYIFLMEF